MNFYTPVARGTITFNLLRCRLVCFTKNEIYLALKLQCLFAMRTLTKSSLSTVRMVQFVLYSFEIRSNICMLINVCNNLFVP